MRAVLQNPAARSAASLARGAARVLPSAPVRGMASGKDIIFGNDARAKLLIGVDRLADVVKVTLGPKVRSPFSSLPAEGIPPNGPGGNQGACVCLWH